jgi:hypothetical protein
MKDRRLIFKKWTYAGTIFLWILTLLAIAPAAGAQAEQPSAAIHSLDTSKFPAISFKLDPRDQAGAFLAGLTAADLTVIENGKELKVENLAATKARAQIVVALNPAMVMVNQYNKSNVYEKIQTALQEWAKKQPLTAGDDYNLVVNDGTLAMHLSQPADLAKVIGAYQPNLYTVKTNLDSLNAALEMAVDPNIKPEIKKEVLYISPAPAPTFLTGLPALIERVNQAGVRVDVWLVSASPVVTARGADGLKQLAEGTGGDYFIFTGREELPDPDAYLGQIRSQYEVTYQSGIRAAGQHKVKLQISRNQAAFESNEADFALDIRPPHPILVNPPASIMMPVVDVNGNSASQTGFEQPIKIVVEFPDGHSRPLTSSSLYVDGILIDENTAEPFDKFTWHLTEKDENKRHTLQVLVEDSLGLAGTGSASPIDVQQNPESRTLLEKIASSERLLTASAVAAALLGLLILLWLTSRRNRFKVQPVVPNQAVRPTRTEEARAARQISAAAQAPTVPIKHRPAQADLLSKKAVPARPAAEQVVETPPTYRSRVSFAKPASLTRLDQANKPLPNGKFLITRAEITIGSSPGKSILVVDLPSIDALHARLVRTLDDNYFLADCGSIGGTWVNFAPVSTRGVHLVDGDLIHLGRTPFRFELGKPEDRLFTPHEKGKSG